MPTSPAGDGFTRARPGVWQRAEAMERRVEGVVRAQLPSGLYEVEIDGSYRVVAHAGGGVQRNFIRLLSGDRVLVELAERDPARGRIVQKVGAGGRP